MSCNLPALKSTMTRQTRIGNLFWLFCAVWVIYPYIIDRYRGEPAIQSTLTFVNEGHASFIKEETIVKYPNRGSRNNILYDEHNNIMCMRNVVSIWENSFNISWDVKAFAQCAELPSTPFKACTIFSANSKSGIERKFGKDFTICTGYITVNTEGNYVDHN